MPTDALPEPFTLIELAIVLGVVLRGTVLTARRSDYGRAAALTAAVLGGVLVIVPGWFLLNFSLVFMCLDYCPEDRFVAQSAIRMLWLILPVPVALNTVATVFGVVAAVSRAYWTRLITLVGLSFLIATVVTLALMVSDGGMLIPTSMAAFRPWSNTLSFGVVPLLAGWSLGIIFTVRSLIVSSGVSDAASQSA